MNTSYFVAYTEPRLFMLDGTPRKLLYARVTGTAHGDEQSARRELAALSACHTESLGLIRVVTFDDDREPCTPASSTRPHSDQDRTLCRRATASLPATPPT